MASRTLFEMMRIPITGVIELQLTGLVATSPSNTPDRMPHSKKFLVVKLFFLAFRGGQAMHGMREEVEFGTCSDRHRISFERWRSNKRPHAHTFDAELGQDELNRNSSRKHSNGL